MAQKINYSTIVAKRTFYGKNVKEAYLKACRWFASNIIADGKLNDIFAQYIKDEWNDSVILVLHAFLDESQERKHRCKMCKEMHSSFYITESTECSRCMMQSYGKLLDGKLKIKKDYYSEIINRKG